MFFKHFLCLLKKNCTLIARNKSGIITELLFSIFCILALVIFRNIQVKVQMNERSYLNNQKTLFPTLIIPNITKYYGLLRNLSEKYNYKFPFDGADSFKDSFFLNGTNFLNESNLNSLDYPVNMVPSMFFDSSFILQSKLLSSFGATFTNRLLQESILTNYTNFSLPIDISSLSDEEKMELYEISEEIANTNSIKNCQNYLGGYIGLSPKNQITSRLASLFSFIYYRSIYFETDADINRYVKSDEYEARKLPQLCFSISFISSNKTHGYKYSLRFHQANPVHEVFETNQPWRTHPFKKEWLMKSEKYAIYGFLALQLWIDNMILQYETNISSTNITAYICSVITPTYFFDDLPGQLKGRFSIFVIMAYVLPFLKLIYYIMYEKERKIKEGMKMMGMNEAAFYVSWLITYLVIFLLLSLINAVLLKIFIFTFSNYFMIFIIQALYTIALMFHGLFLTVFFSRTKTAVLAGVFIMFIEYLLIQLVQKESVEFSLKAAASLSPIIAMSLSSDLFLEMEASENGVGFETAAILFNNYTVATAIVFFFVSSIMFCLLFLYFDQVFPNEFGKKKKFLFFLGCFWKTVRKQNKGNSSKNYNAVEIVPKKKENHYFLAEEQEKNFEKVANVLLQQKKEKKTVEIQGLTKIFPTGKKAVNNLSFTMYDNQIFVLLGVNGAGKTTTFSMLTGLIPQTSGTISYFSYNSDKDMGEVRKIMGVCPQFDILFDDLTVREHLELYGELKGLPKHQIAQAVNKMLLDLKLEEKANFQSKTLSGGQKRKLSTGIAFIGGSKLIFLDEPTTGMDPTSRRVLWDVLKLYKENKIIILTTHFMDEAEYLGDRIGIMGEGVLKCCGSPVFLKNLYGIGYNLTLIKQNADENPDIIKTIEKIIPGCKLLSEASANMVIQLPMEEVSKFKILCDTLDNNVKKLKISSYGISITSLEEVFLKVAQNRIIYEKEKFSSVYDNKDNAEKKKQEFLLSEIRVKNDFSLCLGQFKALFLKRVYYMRRDIKGFFLELILPILIMLVGIALLYSTPIEDPKGIILSPNIYNEMKIRYSGQQENKIADLMELQTTYFDSNMNKSEWDLNIYQNKYQEQKGSFFIDNFNISILNFTYTVITNSTSPDSGPIIVNQMNQAIIRNILNEKAFKIEIKNYPLAFSETDKENEFLEYQFFTAVLFTLAFAFIPGSLIVFFVKERQYKIKHEQTVSGMRSWVYWLANFSFDLPKCLFPVIFSMLIVKGFKARGLTSDECWECLWLLLIVYIISIIPFTYFSSFFFDEYGYAQTVTFTLHLMLSTILTLIVGLLRIIENSTKVAKAVAYIFRLIPSFSFGYGTFNIANRRVYAYLEGYYIEKSPYDLDIAGMDITYIGATGFFLWVLLIVYEFTNEGEKLKAYLHNRKIRNLSYFGAIAKDHKNDKDILDEKQRLLAMKNNETLLKVIDMKKYFYVPYDKKKIKLAVDSLSLGTQPSECFCLLGVNGAGKTTSFRMLTGEIRPDEGSIYIAGVDAMKDPSKIRDKIGYCPQTDPLLDIISVEQHLYIFAGIKGIPNHLQKTLIEEKMRDLDLFRFKNVNAGLLSGGNKRKLSFAIATLGNPAVIFLDEPSSGMDPESRRFMWNAISKFSGKNSKNSVILTTHLMEEAEALGTRIGIMVNGSFQCLGSAQYLKNRFGKGFEIEIVTEIPSFGDLEIIAKQYNLTMSTALDMELATQLLNKMNLTSLLNDFRNPTKVEYLFNGNYIVFELFAEYCVIEQIGQKLLEYLNENLGECELIEHLYSFYRIKVKTEITISALFGTIEEQKNKLQIKYYSIRQTTLEQIFNMFATGQIADENMEANYPSKKSTKLIKAPTLSVGISKVPDELKNTFAMSTRSLYYNHNKNESNDNNHFNKSHKPLHLFTKMGSMVSSALDQFHEQRTFPKKRTTKVLNFFNSLILSQEDKKLNTDNSKKFENFEEENENSCIIAGDNGINENEKSNQ